MADELDRALRQRDLALMAEQRSRGVAPRKPGILDIGNGVTERLAFLNQTFNPVEGIGSAMRAGSRMLAPDQSYWDRIASLGEMVSGVASIAAPIAAAKAIGVPAASAMMEGLLGFSPARQAAGDMATQFARSESGALPGGGPGRPPLTFDEVARAMQEAQPAPPSGFQNYLERVNPSGTRIAAEDRPNLMMGDMYGMLPRGARRVGRQGDVTFHRGPEGDFYATAFNPDVGEQDVVGYIMPRGDMTELAVVGEMQGKGVGSELQYLFRKENPDAPTGGLTEAGERSLRRTYDRLVSEGIVQPASAPKSAPLDVSRRDASNIFGEGSERVRYTDPQSGGTIEVVVRPDGSASVLELEVPEASRGQGIGQTLQERVMQDFPMMGGQVSSKAAATTAYRLGRRPPGKPDATLEEVFADIDEMSSVNMVSPAMQERLAPAAPSSFRLYQGSPHDFAAERLVRMPDGSTQYIVGRPNVLPDVPSGAEVLRDFPLGRQRMDKIGTGEGAQAYGYGLYGAEAEGVARGYRDALSRPYLATSEGQNIAEKYGDDVANIFEMAGGEPDDMRATVVRLRQIVKENLDDIGVTDVSQLKSEFYGDLPSTIIDFSNRADRLESLLNSGDVKLVNTGHMYELEVNANPEDFLDWDLPLSEQPKKVQEAFRPRIEEFRRLGAKIGNDPDGATLEQIAHPTVQLDDVDWSRGLGEQAADYMRKAGIPGIRYLDAGSRGAGDGSRNYVVFAARACV
jgi:ribosomal protein S18 acetylase RimI-like enzyme